MVLTDACSPGSVSWALCHHWLTSVSDPLTQRGLLWETAKDEDPNNSWHLAPGHDTHRRRWSHGCLTPGKTVPIWEARLRHCWGLSVLADENPLRSVEPSVPLCYPKASVTAIKSVKAIAWRFFLSNVFGKIEDLNRYLNCSAFFSYSYEHSCIHRYNSWALRTDSYKWIL